MDLDAFFAAVEVLENPSLAGKPLVATIPDPSHAEAVVHGKTVGRGKALEDDLRLGTAVLLGHCVDAPDCARAYKYCPFRSLHHGACAWHAMREDIGFEAGRQFYPIDRHALKGRDCRGYRNAAQVGVLFAATKIGAVERVHLGWHALRISGARK
jgi:hypothetical protein